MPIATLTGENDYARSQELRQRVQAFVAEHGDLGLEQLDGEETDFLRIQEALTSLPFLANRKMVVLYNPTKSKDFVEHAEDLLKQLPETTELVIHEPKFDKRSSLYKWLKKQPGFKEFGALDGAGLSRWLVSETTSRGASISLSDARYLIERIGPNQQLLATEIEKLSIGGGEIDQARINELTESTPQSTIFQLIDAAMRGDSKLALELYKQQRAMKVEPQQIIAMFAWQLHVMAIVKTAGERTNDQIAKETKLNPYVVGKTATLAKQVSLGRVVQKIDQLLRIDLRGKRESLDLDAALQYFILDFAT